jgi:ATP-dependent protease HslVU (ClpYQ) peptidase subunit
MPSLFVAVFFALGLNTLAQTVVTLAGGSTTGTTSGSTNGVGTAALFNWPFGVAVDPSGNVVVADLNNHKIRIIYPDSLVITLAGGSSSGTSLGSNDGVGTAALFHQPIGVAVDTSGNVIVADALNNKIRLIYSNRTVITLVGGGSTGTISGSINGVGTSALYFNPTGVAVDASGAVYVADFKNHKIRLIYPDRTVITIAGGSAAGTTSGFNNGVGSSALFSEPRSIAVDTLGAVYVADQLNNKIRQIFPNRTVITLAGGAASGTTSGSTNGDGTAALFSWPYGVAVATSASAAPSSHAAMPAAPSAAAACAAVRPAESTAAMSAPARTSSFTRVNDFARTAAWRGVSPLSASFTSPGARFSSSAAPGSLPACSR